MKIIINLLILVLIFVSIIIGLYLITTSKNKNNSNYNEKINTLVKQAARWAVAASQDNNPYIRNLHANYAQGFIIAINQIFSEKEIKRATGLNIREISKRIDNIQDNALISLSNICPEGKPKEEFLARIAKETN